MSPVITVSQRSAAASMASRTALVTPAPYCSVMSKAPFWRSAA